MNAIAQPFDVEQGLTRVERMQAAAGVWIPRFGGQAVREGRIDARA